MGSAVDLQPQAGPFRSRARVLTIALAMALVAVLVPLRAEVAHASPAAEQRTLGLINTARVSAGRAALTENAAIAGIAREWSRQMATAAQLSHNPSLTTQVTLDWTRLGENVGYTRLPGASHDELAQRLHTSFMNSSAHHANIVGDFTQAGVGVHVASDGTMWMTVVFMKGPGTPISTSGGDGAVAIMGDWNGNGVDTPGWFVDGRWVLRDTNTQGNPSRTLTFGRAGDTPVVGDWNGDGRDGIGVRRGNRWFLRNSTADVPGTDYWLDYGRATDHAVTGDWNGDGRDGIGVVRDARWFLRNSLANVSQTTHALTYGRDTDTPVTGDWNGDGRDGVGVRRGNRWHLRNSLADVPQTSFTLDYGRVTDAPVTGNWNGTGNDGIGVVRETTRYLRNSLANVSQTSLQYVFNLQ